MEEMITALDGVLRELRVRYVIIGGIAASVWGRPRMTVNADVVAVISKQRLPILLNSMVSEFYLPLNRKLLKNSKD